jgi:hypothetical protein
MLGLYSSKLSILVPSMLIVVLPIFAQVAPPPQGYPQQPDPSAQGLPPQPAADGGDQEPVGAGPGVARISLLNGDVSVRRGDSGDYMAATQNAPMMVQDSIQTGAGARAEVQFDATSMIRLAQNTEVHFTDLQQGRVQMQLGRGTVTYRILRDANAQIEIDTPSVSIRPARTGIYRITVTDDGQTYVTPRAGQLEVFTPKGSQMVQVGQTMQARGDSSDPEFQMIGALKMDEWDGWSDSRDRGLQQAWANTSQYVPPDVYGTEDLAGHGQWVNTPEYGYAWAPQVGPDWSPYSVGRWAWEDYYGWTWISSDPWGWAPYHYGRWFNRPGFGWCWWPGRLYERAFWSPALVGFFGFGRGFGGIGFGNIGWVALAPFERFHPWYGRGGGFNNQVFVHNTNITNTYRNARVGNGVISANSQQFGRGGTAFRHVAGSELGSASLVHGAVPVKPTAQAMHFTDRQTSTVARTNFSQSRFASHMTPSATVQRAPFSSQQRSLGGTSSPSGNTFGRSGQSFGTTGNSGSVNGVSTWNRYGGSASQSSPAVQGAKQFGSTPGTRNVPQSSAAPSAGWNRFSSNGGSVSSGNPGRSYAPGYGSNNGRSQLQISPPLVRERGNYNAPSTRYSAPSAPRYSPPSAPRSSGQTYSSPAPHYSAPSYSAPHYSAPSTPHYSAPAQHAAPSGGGGHTSGGGGGGHSSSGGGGRHR